MDNVAVSIGVPTLVRLKGDHVVHMVRPAALPYIRNIPLVITGLALVLANFVFVGTPALKRLDTYQGFASISISCFVALLLALFFVGRRVRVSTDGPDYAGVKFMPQWTLCLIASGSASVVLSLLGAMH